MIHRSSRGLRGDVNIRPGDRVDSWAVFLAGLMKLRLILAVAIVPATSCWTRLRASSHRSVPGSAIPRSRASIKGRCGTGGCSLGCATWRAQLGAETLGASRSSVPVLVSIQEKLRRYSPGKSLVSHATEVAPHHAISWKGFFDISHAIPMNQADGNAVLQSQKTESVIVTLL